MVPAATSVDWTVTASEVDALLLENSLIKTVPAPATTSG